MQATDDRLEKRKLAVRMLSSVVDEPELLREIALNCYRRADVSASWIGPFVPETRNTSYAFAVAHDVQVTAVALATWAKEHWMIYDSFMDEFCSRNQDVLDVGCGSGNTTNLLSLVFPYNRILGIDSDKNTIRFCEKHNRARNIKYVHSDLTHFHKSEGKMRFGYIFACEVLEHIPYDNHYSFVDSCLESLSEDGLLFMTTPNTIDETPTGHHKGLLNREEFLRFHTRYERSVYSFSFIDNKILSTCSRGIEAVIKEDYQKFDSRDKNRSHFRFVLRKAH